MTKDQANAQEILWRAQADQDLATLTPEQLAMARRKFEIEQQALHDWDRKNAAIASADMDRKIARMSDQQLQEIIQDADLARAREGK